MATLKELRKRISGVENIQQITRAMKMVAGARLRRAEEAILALRPYASHLERFSARFLLDAIGSEHPFFREREVESYILIGVASDRGLCGAYNHRIVDACHDIMEERQGQECRLYIIGGRGIQQMENMGYDIDESYEDVFNPVKFAWAESVAQKFQELFLHGSADEVLVVFSEFFNPARQEVRTRSLLPLDVQKFTEQVRQEYDRELPHGVEELPEEFRQPEKEVYLYEPSFKRICMDLVHRNISVQFYRALLEAQASEQGARMVAMDNATQNAEEMIDDLTLKMNRQRQENITREILDVIGGAQELE